MVLLYEMMEEMGQFGHTIYCLDALQTTGFESCMRSKKYIWNQITNNTMEHVLFLDRAKQF